MANVETPLAQKGLAGEFQDGDTVRIDAEPDAWLGSGFEGFKIGLRSKATRASRNRMVFFGPPG